MLGRSDWVTSEFSGSLFGTKYLGMPCISLASLHILSHLSIIFTEIKYDIEKV